MDFGIMVPACISCGLRDLTKNYHREAVGDLSEEFKLSAVQVQELMDLGADHDAGTCVYLVPGPDEPPMRVDISSLISSYRARDGTYYHLHPEFVDINKEGNEIILM